jgi:hypothetical protein
MSDFDDIDIDDEELLKIQHKLHTLNHSSKQFVPVKMDITKTLPNYTSTCLNNINEYKKHGTEINAALRGVQNYPGLNSIVFNIDKCFQQLCKLYPKTPGNYIQVYRMMSQKFDPNKNQGYISTSNQIIGMSHKFIYTIIIPYDAKVIVIDISNMVGKKNTFEIVLERETKFILGETENTLIVQTSLSRSNKL